MVISDKTYTLEEFHRYAAQYPERILELIDGRIVEKVTTQKHGKIAGWLVHLLIVYLQEHPEIRGHWAVESSHKPVGDDTNEHRPDVSFCLTDTAVSDESYLEGMPDFVAEIKSASNTYDGLREKARFYLKNGSRLVWLIYPEPKFVEVYFGDGTSAAFKEGQSLAGGDVLPGFIVQVSDLFNL